MTFPRPTRAWIAAALAMTGAAVLAASPVASATAAVTCDGRTATIVGTPGDNCLVGNS